MSALVRFGCLVGMLSVSLCLADAPKKATHESVLQDFLKALTNGTDCLANVKDKATAEKAAATLKQEIERLKVMAKDAAALGPPSKEENNRLAMKYDKDIQAAQKKLGDQWNKFKAGLKTLNLPDESRMGLVKAMQAYGAEMRGFGKALIKWEAKP